MPVLKSVKDKHFLITINFLPGSSFKMMPTIQDRQSTSTSTSTSAISDVTKSQPGTSSIAVPLIDIGTRADEKNDGNSALSRKTSRSLVSALRDSGFALVRSPLLTPQLQSKALEATSRFLAMSSSSSAITGGPKSNDNTPVIDVISHPTDPKVYAMLDSEDQYDMVAPDNIIREYVAALQLIKMDVLRHISVGLFEDEDIDNNNDVDDDDDDKKKNDVDFFAKLHDENNDTLRLITYFPTHSETTANRCKEHSDYGTITLLSTDGVSGLELFHKGQWLHVPYIEGGVGGECWIVVSRMDPWSLACDAASRRGSGVVE